VVVSLGKPEDNGNRETNVKGYLGRAEREELLNRSKIVVARSGYSTLMDLCSLRKKGFLIPTPGQPEQEYLAKFHMDRRSFYSVKEKDLDFKSQLEDALPFRSPELKYPTEKAVENAIDVITGTARTA
jgi:predicted glycosyltransferase